MKPKRQISWPYRPSFTLVELLVVIAIIGIMSGMILFALAGARQDANISRTRRTITKLNAIILQEWEEFRYRSARIDIDPEMLRPQAAFAGQPPLSPREGARLRMIVLRDLMRMEMPDRLSDIVYPPTAYKAALFTADNSSGITSNDLPYYTGAAGTFPGTRPVPPKYNNYRLKVGLGAVPSPYTGAVIPIPSSLPPTLNTTHQGAEWLYQIVAAANYQGGSAMEAFNASEIDDVDGDGLFEFVDAWGTPIRWLRWPAGFPSPLNIPYQRQDATAGIPERGSPDAMDPIRTDWRWPGATPAEKPWLLVPLIISAGPDRVFDVSFDQASTIVYATQTWSGTNSPAHAAGGAYFFPDPYVGTSSGVGLGSLFDEDSDGTLNGASDNITNHSLILE